MSEYYKLDGKNIIVCEDVVEWAKWYEKADRHVADDTIGDQRISTVFRGLNHGLGENPVLFETMVFGGNNNGFKCRYCFWETAEEGHKRLIERLKAGETL